MIRVAHFNRHRDDVHDVIDDRDDSADDLKHMNVTVH
jgi:hypothetical protein